MDHTLALIGRIHQGDKEARDTLFSENMGLVYSVARRFLGRGVEMEDLFQIGSIGLLKAVDHFNPEFDVKFSTYAVPMIIGEIKRFLRDDGILKVSRSIKENQYKICKMREELEKKLGREPDLRELSDAMDMPMEELAMTLESAAEVDSIYKTVYQGDGTDLQLVDRLPEKEDRHEKLLNRIFLEEILEKLEGEEKRLIVFRYFQDMTQTEVAKKMGMSQVQISRMEKRILKKLREMEKKSQSETLRYFPGFIDVPAMVLIPANSPTNCDAHLAESLFQTRSGKGEKSKVFSHIFQSIIGC